MKIKRENARIAPAKWRLEEEIQELQQRYANINVETVKRFADFPLSEKTLRGLADAKFTSPTDIQRQSIGPALQGKDVLGAAITGSGKTLAFLIPVLEHLFISKWSRTDGISAIIISPTRELAYQIFETLKKIGKHHDFSGGLIIGGKNLKFERTRMDQCNILICTPGRLLQHMDENPLFNASSMELLVLDEADRCLDMGFEQTLNAIVENFPPDRQTLLFSATQTNSVKDLARLNLRDPIYIGHQRETKTHTLAVPDLLQQNYVVVALEEKLTVLWSFIKNHQKQKIIVFLASCKQVKYVYEIFCKLRPGTPLLALYGTLHQDRRIAIYNDFVKKSHVVMFATDIASRGLDFPSINWVVQLDCPEDVSQYVHRAGRSARNKTHGESLLVLTPTEEEGMIELLEQKKMNVRKIHIDPKKLFSPRVKVEAYLAQSPELKASAQRAFHAYLKSVFLMQNKRVFRVFELNLDAYAKSLGLAVTPRVRFLDRFLKKTRQEIKATDEVESESDAASIEAVKKTKLTALKSGSDSDDDFLVVKRADHEIGAGNDEGVGDDNSQLPLPVPRKEKLVTKAALAKKVIKKKIQINEKRKFDEEGREIFDARKQMQSELAKEYEKDSDSRSAGGIDLSVVKQVLNEEDKYDKQRFRELVKQRHKKLKEKQRRRDDEKKAPETSAEEEDAEGGTDSDYSVDLSWLPDPSKVYAKYDGSEHDGTENASDTTNSEDEAKITDSADNDEPASKKLKITSKLTITDAEAIAAQLLAKS